MENLSGIYNAEEIGVSLGPWGYIGEVPDIEGRTVWFGKDILLPTSLSTGVLFGKKQTPFDMDYPVIAPYPYYSVAGQLPGHYEDLVDLNPDVRIYEINLSLIHDPGTYPGNDYYYLLYVNFSPGGSFDTDNLIYHLSIGAVLGAFNPIYVKDIDTWVPAISVQVKNGDTWGDYTQMFVKNNGVWEPRI